MKQLLWVGLVVAAMTSPASAALYRIDFAGQIVGGFDATSGSVLNTNLPTGTTARGSLVYDSATALHYTSFTNGSLVTTYQMAQAPAIVTEADITLNGRLGQTTFSFDGARTDYPGQLEGAYRTVTGVYAGTATNGAQLSESIRFTVDTPCFFLPGGGCFRVAATSESNDQTGLVSPTYLALQFTRSGGSDLDLFGLANAHSLDFDLEAFTGLPGVTATASLFYGGEAGFGSRELLFTTFSVSPVESGVAVPEPAALGLLGLGTLAIGISRRRRIG